MRPASAGREPHKSTAATTLRACRFLLIGRTAITVADMPESEPGRRLFAAAVTLFVVGLLAIVAIFVIHASSDGRPGTWLYLAAMAAPLGFGVGIVAALRSGRRARR